MKRNLTPGLFFLMIMLALPLLTDASNGDLNKVDAQGQRQGFWVITGFMSNDRAYAPDEKVEEGHYKDNRKEGVWKKFWPGGVLRSEITYAFGKPQGAYSLYYMSGSLEESGYWINNRNTGEFKRFHSNGKPQQWFVFSDSGKRNGWQKYYHENGKLALEVQVLNGLENGVSKRYSTEGTLLEEKSYEKGVLKPGSIKTFREPKEIEAPPMFDPYDKAVGKESTVTKDQTNKAETFKPDGHNTLYNKAGDITQTGEFLKGKLRNGKWYKYSSDGILIRVEIYKNGRFVGTGVINEEDL